MLQATPSAASLTNHGQRLDCVVCLARCWAVTDRGASRARQCRKMPRCSNLFRTRLRGTQRLKDGSMGKLRVKYVQRLRQGAEELSSDDVEFCVGVSATRVNIEVLRRGFILAAPVMDTIRERINRLALATADINKSFPERIGIYPQPNPEWRQFLDDLLQKDGSWSFLVGFSPNQRLS